MLCLLFLRQVHASLKPTLFPSVGNKACASLMTSASGMNFPAVPHCFYANITLLEVKNMPGALLLQRLRLSMLSAWSNLLNTSMAQSDFTSLSEATLSQRHLTAHFHSSLLYLMDFTSAYLSPPTNKRFVPHC